MFRLWLRLSVCLGMLLAVPGPGWAQDEHAGHEGHDQALASTATPSWHWSTAANVFFGYNYQRRLFADFSAWESQNWVMASAQRSSSRGALTLNAMFSLEPA